MANYIVTDKIRVNIVHSVAVPPRVKCEQYDGDYTRQIEATIYNGDVLYIIPSLVRRIVISGLKPDATGFSYDCTWSGSKVLFSLMRQMTVIPGDVVCNISMFDANNNQVSSAVFVLAVEKAALPSDVVVSSNDFQTFVDYVQAAHLYSQYSKSYAVGNTGIRNGENTDNSQYYAHLARMYKGAPLTAATASAMSDTTRVYVYTGSEDGYNNGHWYFYNDSTWEDGGVYNAQGVQTDTELVTPDVAADAEATGLRITALETQNGDEALETIASTHSGAINEVNAAIKLSNVLKIQHEATFSSDIIGGQCGLYYNGKYLLIGDSDNKIYVSIVNSNTYALENIYEFSLDIHPNACFIANSYLFVVDSDNYDLYKFDITTMEYEEKITNFEYIECKGGCCDGSYVYLWGGFTVLKLSLDLELIETITLQRPAHSTSTLNIIQGVFVYNNVIYLIYNNPNAIVTFDMLGNLLNVNEFPEGDGFYPMGELEGLIDVDDEIKILCGCYKTRSSVVNPGLTSYGQLFKSSITRPILNNSKIGQSYPISGSNLNVNNSVHYYNADGSVSKPFSTLYEASCVANYNKGYFNMITATINADSSDDLLELNGTYDIVYSGNYPISNALFNQGIITSKNVVFDKIYIVGGILDVYGTISSLRARGTELKLNGSKITTEFNIARCGLRNEKLNIQCQSDKVTLSSSNFANLLDVKEVNMALDNAEWVFSDFLKKYIFTTTSQRTSYVSFRIRVHGIIDEITTFQFRLSTSDKSTINGNGYVEIPLVINANLSGGYAKLAVTFKIQKSNIIVTSKSATIDGVSVGFPNIFLMVGVDDLTIQS